MPAQCGSLAFSDADIEILTETTERMTNNDQGNIKPRAKMTDFIHAIHSTRTQATEPQSSSSKKPLSQELAKKRQTALNKIPCLQPKRRGFCTSDEFEVTCLVFKGSFPWQQESQGRRTVLPMVHTEPRQLPLPKSTRVQIHPLCHCGTGEGRGADYIQPRLENAIFPRALLV